MATAEATEIIFLRLICGVLQIHVCAIPGQCTWKALRNREKKRAVPLAQSPTKAWGMAEKQEA